MKKIKIAILCCIAILCSTSLYSQETFKPVRVVDRLDVLFSKLSQDGGYIVCQIKVSSKTGDAEASVISKFDVNGNELWYKEVKEMVIIDCIEFADASLMCVGQSSDFNDMDVTVRIIKLNACGELEWSKIDYGREHGYNRVHNGATIIDVGDGCIIPVRSANGRNDNMFIMKIDYEGNVLWNRLLVLEKSCTSRQLAYSNVDSDGNIVLSGLALVRAPGYDEDDGAAVDGTLIVKIDRDGNLLWEASSHHDFRVYSVPWERPLVDNENNTFMTIQCGWSESDYESYAVSNSPIIRIDERGNAVANEIVNPDTDTSSKWSQNVDGFAWTDNKEHIVTSMRFMPAGYEGVGNKSIVKPSSNKVDKSFIYPNQKFTNATMSKSNSDDVEEYSHFINRLYVVDKNAEVVRQLDIDDYKTGELTRSILTVENDNLLVISSNALLYEGHEYYDSHIRKYTSDLKPASIDETERSYDPFCSTGVKSGVVDLGKTTPLVYAPTAVNDVVDAEKSIRVYPNPATGSVKLYLSRGIGQKIVDFYDPTGRLCKSTTIGEGWAQENVDISDLPSGIYFLKLTVDNKVIGNEKLIIK